MGGGLWKSLPGHQLVMEVFGPCAHPSGIEGDIRFHTVERCPDVTIDDDRHHRENFKFGEGFSTACPSEALLQPRPVVWHGTRHKTERQPAIAQFRA